MCSATRKRRRFPTSFSGCDARFWRSARASGVRMPRPRPPSDRPDAASCKQRPFSSGAALPVPGRWSAASCHPSVPSLRTRARCVHASWRCDDFAAAGPQRTACPCCLCAGCACASPVLKQGEAGTPVRNCAGSTALAPRCSNLIIARSDLPMAF
jgi:hypothetical protein